jgi:wyosine [tRNA(Phe)-imidazoG37] synthetase (radical SAM superfamily)
VDLVPFKTCTYDCIYCQLGRTTTKTLRREQWVDVEMVLEQVRAGLERQPDVITLAGSGEPTLHAGIGAVIAGLKRLTSVPVVVLTNGSLLSDPHVRRDLAAADIVIPSLDAPSEGLFQLVNRPHRDLHLSDIVDGMVAFRQEYVGQIWVEVMLLAGITGIADEVERLAELATRIRPDRIHLNTAVRPPAESYVDPVPEQALHAFAGFFTPPADVVTGRPSATLDGHATRADVLALLSRRPCSTADVAAGLGIHYDEALKSLAALVDEGAIKLHTHEGAVFYAAHETGEERS